MLEAVRTAARDDRLIAAYALVAHVAGDYPLQPDWMATAKLEDPLVRAIHVSIYAALFVPVVRAKGWDRRRAVAFLAGIWGTHFLIDTRRWTGPVGGFEAFPIWLDQTLHLLAIAVLWTIVTAWRRE